MRLSALSHDHLAMVGQARILFAPLSIVLRRF